MTCRICGNKVNNTKHEVPEMMFGSGERFYYFQCSHCECLQILEIPEDLERHYPEGYFSFSQPNPNKRIKSLKQLLKQGFGWMFFRFGPAVKQLLSRLVKGQQMRYVLMLNLSKQSRILDVGSGGGGYLQSLADVGFENLTGVDPFVQKNITLPNGIQIIKGSLNDIEGQWELITFNHSFEHMQEPLDILRTTRSLLSDDGACMLRIPTVSSFAWKHYGKHWIQIDAPRHLFLYSIQSLRALADQADLVIEDIVYDSDRYQFWGSEQILHGIPLSSERSWNRNREQSIFSNKSIREFTRRAKQLNQEGAGDQAIFLLKKK
jgi:hypothetical protein